MPLPRWLLPTLMLAACAGNEANHIPHPLALPGAVVSTAVGNSLYNAKRNKVKAYVAVNLAQLDAEIAQGGGPGLTHAMGLAGVPVAQHPALAARLHADRSLYQGDAEALTIALMVHGG